MRNSLFDSFVKKQLSDYRPEVPAHVWEKIAAETGRKKPVAFWSFGNIAAAVLLVLTASGITWFLAAKNSSSAPSPSSKNSITTSPVKENNNSKNNSVVTPQINTAGAENSVSSNKTAPAQMPNGIFSAALQRFHSPASMSLDINSAEAGDEKVKLNEAETNDLWLAGKISAADMLKTKRYFNPGIVLPLFPNNLSIPCPRVENEAAGNKKYLEIYGGPDYAFRSITDPYNAAYMEQRKASTKILFAYSAGVRFTKVFGSGVSVRSGLNYSQINESFKLVKGHVTQNVYITDASGDTTGTYTVSGTQYKQNTNKYRSIDIPIMAGYEIGNGRLHTNINAGVMINIHSKQTGYVVDANGNAVDIGSAKSSVYQYKTNTGVSLTGGVSVYYKITDRLHVLAEPYFRYSLSPVTQSELQLKQKYHAAGLRIGIRADL